MTLQGGRLSGPGSGPQRAGNDRDRIGGYEAEAGEHERRLFSLGVLVVGLAFIGSSTL
jgi:hypothetical protein